ncbi:hypothetical protein HZ326_9462 [Fusarium oxysporum f. sp. albedinis]|nr:hypothetical protein HZ326_9462 [Fusarium oxysporum f. sp. albedinis]
MVPIFHACIVKPRYVNVNHTCKLNKCAFIGCETVCQRVSLRLQIILEQHNIFSQYTNYGIGKCCPLLVPMPLSSDNVLLPIG